mgnify:CR=1 FL=1
MGYTITITIISILAPSRERPAASIATVRSQKISILAPSRERHHRISIHLCTIGFQSSLPHGSDDGCAKMAIGLQNFNPRSLTGATVAPKTIHNKGGISILAPSRERLIDLVLSAVAVNFNPRSLTGATCSRCLSVNLTLISILAPSRERLSCFISSLPLRYFNPRSLTGATACL